MRAALDGVRQLAPVRTALLANRATVEQILGTYAPVHLALIDSLRLPYDVDTRTSVGRQVLALDRILRKSEGISAGAALIVLIAADPNPGLATAYVANMATLQADSNQMLGLLTPEQLVLMDIEQAAVDARAGEDFLEQSALDPVTAASRIPIEALYPTTSSLITLGQFVEKKLVTDVTAEVRAERQAALSAAYWVTALVLVILLVVGLLALLIGRAVARPLTNSPAPPTGSPGSPNPSCCGSPTTRRTRPSRSVSTGSRSGGATRSATWPGPSNGSRPRPPSWWNGRWRADATWPRCSVTSVGVRRTSSAARSP